jgi:hypothetical protein
MSTAKEFEEIFLKKKVDDMLLFLKTLTEPERKALVPQIKSLAKEYLTHHTVGNSSKFKATDDQHRALAYASFICFNSKEFAKSFYAWIISREHLEKIFPWYVPSWFSNYINSFSSRDWLPYALDYLYVVELMHKGILSPNEEILTRLLVQVLYENIGRGSHFKPERLLVHEETLAEHIWYLFRHESTIAYIGQYVFIDGKKAEPKGWMHIFKTFVAEGKIDRLRILKESLLASNRNFNKNLSGWFAELFLQLKPTNEEMIAVQPELFVLFSSPHSKVINVALQSCKAIADDASFAADDFLDAGAIILTSETKSVIASALQILEKLARKYPGKRRAIMELITPVFIQKDEALQARAAKLVQKFATANDEALKEMISTYSATLFSSTKELLKDYLETTVTEEEPVLVSTEKADELADAMALPSIKNFDDLVFLCSQAFDNNETWHIDFLPAALLQWDAQMEGSHIAKLEPAFQRALKLYLGDWRSGIGYLDRLLACFFIDYCMVLLARYPSDAGGIKKICDDLLVKHEGLYKQWQEYGFGLTFLRGWKANSDEKIYYPYKKFLVDAIDRIKGQQYQPFLSTPTHAPSFIDPKVFVKRLISYKGSGVTPGGMDVQIAISRCWLGNTDEAIDLARRELTGETLLLTLFLLDPNSDPRQEVDPQSEWLWAITALSKSPRTLYPQWQHFEYAQNLPKYTGQYKWKAQLEDYTYDQHYWEGSKHWTEKKTAQHKKLTVDFSIPQAPPTETGLKKWFKGILSPPKNEEAKPADNLLYDWLQLKASYISVEDCDIQRLIFLAPNNPEPLLAFVTSRCFAFSSFLSETEKRMVIETLKALHAIWKPFGEMAHLFIAASMICADKTAASYAAEIWIKGVQDKSIDSNLIGAILGKIERIEFAPFKRFTDLVMDMMVGISPVHNKALQEMFTSLLKGLPEVPVKNLKKALEIYFELLNTNRSEVKDLELERLLKVWKEKDGLKRVVKLV